MPVPAAAIPGRAPAHAVVTSPQRQDPYRTGAVPAPLTPSARRAMSCALGGEYREYRFAAGLTVPAPVDSQRLDDLKSSATLTPGTRDTHHRSVRRAI